MMQGLVTQAVRTVMQFVWSALASWGLLELVNTEAVEVALIGAVTAVLLAVISWAERKLPWIGNLFIFAKTPSYER